MKKFKVRPDAPAWPIVACGGMEFSKNRWTSVDEPWLNEAQKNPWLMQEEVQEEVDETPAEPAPVAVEAEPEPADLLSHTVAELRQMADAKGLSWSGLKKAELVALLEGVA